MNTTAPQPDVIPDWQEITIPLSRPVTEGRRGKGRVLYTSVTIYEPDAEAMDAIEQAITVNEKGEDGILIATIVAMSDLTKAEAQRLHHVDLQKISDAVAVIMPQGNGKAPGAAPE